MLWLASKAIIKVLRVNFALPMNVNHQCQLKLPEVNSHA